MQASATELPEVMVLEPQVFGDDRGFFLESFSARRFAELTGCGDAFVQDNHSRSTKGVLRGLHYQLPPMAQGKLVRVVSGEIFDVAVDIRRSSPNFGKWVGVNLSAQNKHQLWVPKGFAHGFYVVSDIAEVVYKVTDYYAPRHECCLRWDDAAVGIRWPLSGAPSLSAKDRAGASLRETEGFP